MLSKLRPLIILIAVFVVLMCWFLWFKNSAGSELQAAEQKPSTANRSIAQKWSVADKNYDHMNSRLFNYIYLTKDEKYKNDLLEYIYLEGVPFRQKANAAKALVALGWDDGQSVFNDLLKATDQTGITKKEILDSMIDCNIPLPDNTAEIIDEYVKQEMKAQRHFYAIRGATQYLEMGIYELSPELKRQLSADVTNQWQWTFSYNIEIADLDPDWDKMFEKAYKDAEKVTNWQKFRFVKMAFLLFIHNADKDAKQQFCAGWEEEYSIDNFPSVMKLLAAASINDKKAVDILLNDHKAIFTTFEGMNRFSMQDVEHIIEELPDSVLISMLSGDTEDLIYYGFHELPVEMERRGLKSHLDKFDAKCMQELDSMKPGEKFYANKTNNLIDHIARKDTIKALDMKLAFWKKHSKNYSVGFDCIQGINNSLHFRPDHVKGFYTDPEGTVKWIKSHSDDVISILRGVLSDDATQHFRTTGQIDPQSDDAIYNVMIYLSNDHFNKYFSQIDSARLSKSAFLTGLHFNAPWVEGLDQDEFYRQFDRNGFKKT